MNAAPAGQPAGWHAAHGAVPANPQQDTRQLQQNGCADPGQAAVLASAIDIAVASCIAAGVLPQAQYVASSAGPPTPKQRKRMPPDVR